MKIRQGFVSNSSSSSFCLIGLRTSISRFQEEQEVRNCRCEVENIESMKFCPKCGKTVMTTTTDWIEGVDDDGVGSFSFECDYESDDLFIYLPGTYAYSYDYDVELTELPDNIYEQKAALKELAEKYGIWDESKFGFWSGQRYS